jgi:hypothetical protein
MDISNNLSKIIVNELSSLVNEMDNFSCSWGKVVSFMGVDESPLLHQARDFMYNNNLIIHFNWSDDKDCADYLNGKKIIEYDQLDKIMVLKLLTASVRADRFITGFWLTQFEKGVAQKLFHRLYEIESE